MEAAIQRVGGEVFTLMDAAEPPSVFSKKGFYGTMMEWAMKDEHFKTQLFRFVDVLPALASSGEVARHLQEYLGTEEANLSPALRMGLKAAGGASWLVGAGVTSQVTALAGTFMPQAEVGCMPSTAPSRKIEADNPRAISASSRRSASALAVP